MADEPSKKDVASYYYEVGGKEHGPVTMARLVELVKLRTVRGQTPVWTDAMPVKTPAHKLPFVAAALPKPTGKTPPSLLVGGGVALVGLGVLGVFLWMVPSAAAREAASACRGLSGFERPNKAICPDGAESCALPVPAPDFTMLDHNNQPVKLSSFRGKVVLLNFWASWCGTCKAEKQGLAEMAQELAAPGFEVIALASDNAWPKVLVALVQSLAPNTRIPAPTEEGYSAAVALDAYKRGLPDGPPFQVFLDPPKGDDTIGVIARRWGLDKVPETALIDRDGNIRAYFVNKRDWSSAVAQTCIRAVIDE